VEPASVLHVGDHLTADIEGARGVGIDGVLIDRGGRVAAEDVPPGTVVIGSLEELLPIVDARMNGR
jgi:FMN phosphatase YigB (HAD superfamily)